MKIGQSGINLIKQFEGCILEAYKCPAGVWTIGYGHTAGVTQGQKITQAQADAFLLEDLAKFEKKVEKYSKYSWRQNEFDALVSFAYNVGSIDQLTANGTRSRQVIAEKMLLYNKAKGKVLPGLTRRREAERQLFMQGAGETVKEPQPVSGVIVGSARINEKGSINGGAAGDQTGGEVSTQAWYLHSKGWIVIRAKDPSAREKVAQNMQAICDNNYIGYCQDHRTTLTNAAKPYGYDASKVKTKVEVDCSEAVRNCVLYAGIAVGTFNTASEVSVLGNTGKFDILRDDKYCKSPDYLLRGDILVTKTKGHTVAVLANGAKASGSSDPASGSAASSTLAVGTIVNFTGSLHYTSSNAANGKNCKPGKAKITNTYNGNHPYHLEAVSGGGSTVYGWVDAADIQEASAGSSGQASGISSEEIKVGDTVNYSGTVHYTSSYASGKSRACKGGKAKITQISKGQPHPYHLVSAEKSCTVHGWVNADEISDYI